MSKEPFAAEDDGDINHFQQEIPVRGCSFSLPHLQAVYRELENLNKTEADKLLGKVQKVPDQSDEDFEAFKRRARERAFRLTVSIVGEDGQTSYGESEKIFESRTLPFPIAIIFFTNENSFKAETNGRSPPNYLRLWIHFDKPPLLDPYPLLSEPTPNASNVFIRADDLVYFRAVQTIINDRLKKNKLWYSALHAKFAYDMGLWFVAIPYSFYTVTVLMDKLLPVGGSNSSFRIPFFLYGAGLSLLIYRAVTGYLKWAFPVNVLEENKDNATKHRVFAGVVVVGLIVNLIWAILTAGVASP